MTRADFWCRVLGWLQVASGVATGALIWLLWNILFSWIDIEDGGFFTFLMWIIIAVFVLPVFLSGLFTILFANAVEQARNGLREQGKILLRILMALSGLWAAGFIGFAGLSFPVLGLFGILSLLTVGLAIMGPDWTADLFASQEPAS